MNGLILGIVLIILTIIVKKMQKSWDVSLPEEETPPSYDEQPSSETYQPMSVPQTLFSYEDHIQEEKLYPTPPPVMLDTTTLPTQSYQPLGITPKEQKQKDEDKRPVVVLRKKRFDLRQAIIQNTILNRID